MANDFTGLSAQIDRAVELINEAVSIITAPASDNNDQSVIDALTLRLQGAADALQGVEPAVAEPAPAAAPEPVASDLEETPA